MARKTRSRSSARFAVKSWYERCARAGGANYSHHDQQSEVPDPGAEATFASARLSWSWPEGTARAGLRRLYRDLLTARREWPALRDFVSRSARLIADREREPGARARPGRRSEPMRFGPSLTSTTGPTRSPPMSTREETILFSSEAVAYSGSREQFRHISEILPFECVVFGPASWRSFP